MFVLTVAVANENEILLGVYSTREIAEAAARQFLIDEAANVECELPSYDDLVIRELTVDAPAEFYL